MNKKISVLIISLSFVSIGVVMLRLFKTNLPSYRAPSGTKYYAGKMHQLSFFYPMTYKEPEEHNNYISIISPLNANRGKGYDVQNGELKIEIYISEATSGSTLEQILTDGINRAETTILKEEAVTIGGITGVRLRWAGAGTGETIFLLHNGKKYYISKYPGKTTRDAEYNQILSTFKLY